MVYSLDAKLQSGDSDSSLLDVQSENDPDIEESDWIEAVEGLRQVPEVADALATLELAQEATPTDVAELLDCNVATVRKKLRDMKAQVREHTPSHIRERICGIERKLPVKLEEQGLVLQPHVARELVPAGCNSNSEFMPEAISAPPSNGHHQSLESEAMEVIASVQSEAPAAEAVKPTRKRRSREEVAAEKASTAVALKINGMDMEGSPADIAAVMKALNG